MRSLFPATFLAVAFLAGSLAGALTEPQGPSAGAPAAPAQPAPVKASPVPSAGTSPDNDAAAKHAKRTACLTEARTKKLVGAQKTAFIKECVGAAD